MTEPCVSSLHIQKLGHHLEEIRVRALHSILSKLNCGFIQDRDLTSRPELLKKLIEWFCFDTISEEENVLELILRILKADEGAHLLMLLKMPDMVKLLDAIKEKLGNAKLQDLFKQICELVSDFQGINIGQMDSCRPSDGGGETSRTATTFELFIHGSESDEPCGVAVKPSSAHEHGFFAQPGDVPLDQLQACFPCLVLPWQPLCPTDQHIVATVEESLTDTPSQFCQFFSHVMLQDFPAEVFLQRPRIVKTFLTLLEPTSDKETQSIQSLVLKCLYDLTNNLHIRVEYYSDPCMHNLKQEDCLGNGSNLSTPPSQSARSDSCSEGQPTAGQYLQNCDLGQQSPRRTLSNHEDQLLLQLRQLGLPQFCLSVLERTFPLVPTTRAFPLVWSLVNLMSSCVTATLWLSTDRVAQEVSQLVKNVFCSLGDTLANCRYSCRLSYLQLLSVVPKLFSHLVLTDFADVAVPAKLRVILADSLFDYSLLTLYPQLHSELLQLIQMFSDPKIQEKLHLYSDATKLCESLKTTAHFLKNASELSGAEFLHEVNSILLSIPVHGNMSVVKQAVDIYFSKAHNWHLDGNGQKQSSDILLKMLAHTELCVRLETYKACHRHVVAALGVAYVHYPLATNHIMLLFDTPVLVEILCYGASSPTKEVQQYAEEILIHLLKGKFLISDQMWRKFVESLIPALPLLLCYASKASALGRVITKMLDPDVSSTVFFSSFVVLKGNLILLFSDQSLLREEALTRLIWLLTKQPHSSNLLPDVLAINTSELSNILIVDKKINLFHTKLPQVYYEPGSLCQVLELLESSFVESAVRRSALTQISVMLDDPHLHGTFIELKGVDLILKMFHSALVKKDFTNSPESVIPIVSILRSLAHHTSTLRQELALQESVFYLILRAGLMFGDSQRHRVCVAHLLCLLLYSDYLLPAPSSEERTKSGTLSLPHLVVCRMQLPFQSSSHWCSSPHTQPSSKGVTKEEKVCRMLSHCWTMEWFGGLDALLNWTCVQAVPGSNKELHLSMADLAALKQSTVIFMCEENLRAIQKAGSHFSVHRLLHTLTRYTWLQMAVGSRNISWNKLPWEETFCRFLATQPASSEDDKLLASVLDFLRLHVNKFPHSGVEWEWLSRGLQASDGPLLGLLDILSGGGVGEPSRELCRAALQLCEDCVLKGSSTVVLAISRCLSCSDSQHFYNLALLVWMLSCLTHLTSCPGWSGEAQAEWQEMAGRLSRLVVAFHCGSNAGSFMGLAVTRSAVLCMNHVLAEMQECTDRKQKWAEVWQLTLGESYQLWLPSLWHCRDPVVRAGSLQLLAGLCMSPSLCTLLLASFDLLSMALSFVVDHRESSLVREHAANLLTNITSHKKRTPLSSERDVLQETLQDLGEILEKYDFYQELGTILPQLYVAERLIPCKPSFNRWRVESLSGRKLSPHNNYPEDQVMLVCDATQGLVDASSKPGSTVSGNEDDDDVCRLSVAAPSFVGACCWLLVNLLALDERHTLTNLIECGIITVLFGCLGGASTPAGCSVSMHADLVEMKSAVCSLLCKCVALSATCRTTILRLPGCLHTLFLLVNPADYSTESKQMLFLRNCLWSEVFRLISALLVPDNEAMDGFKAVCSALHHCGRAPFLEAVKLSLTCDCSPDLQNSSLVSLTSLLAPEVTDTVTRRNNINENMGSITSYFSLQNLLDERSAVVSSPATSSASNAEGAELCELLLRLFDAHLLQHGKYGSLGKGAVVGALSSLLAVSHSAKHCALQRGLHVALITRARDLHLRLSLDSAECLRKLSHKKRICPVLDDLRVLFCMLTNFMVGSSSVKSAVAQVGLADLVHKVWVWCTALPSFTTETLKLLCTLTTDCLPGSHSLVLTTTVPGVGLRKTPSAASLLHVMVALIQKELDLVSHSHDQYVLGLVFQLLRNASHSQECRIVLAKDSLLQSFLLIHPSHTKNQKCWDSVETLWLQFLADFTFHPEGQLALPKVSDCLELLLWLTSCGQRSSRLLSLVVLRNITFHHLNRPRLLASPEFLRVLGQALSEGEAEEKGLAAGMVWALVANNQKAKLVIKCSGLTTQLQEALNQLRTAHDQCAAVQVLEYVLRLLQSDNR